MNILRKLSNGKELVIRPAKIEDAKSIIDYFNKIDSESDGLLFEEDLTLSTGQQEIIIQNYNLEDNDLLCISTIDNEIVSVSKLSSSQTERTSHIGNMAISISTECHCDDIKKTITEAILDYAKSNTSIKTINLMVNTKSIEDIKLYESTGFEKVGVFKDYFYHNNEYVDAVIMNNYLE